MPPENQGNVKSLSQLCKNVLIKHVNAIEDVGDLNYTLLRPILLKISSPKQLKTIESKCPQIAGEDAEIWKMLISRDFGSKAVGKHTPRNAKSWSKIYDIHQKESDKDIQAATLVLKEKLTKMTSKKAESRAKLITNTSGLPPTNSRPRGYGRIGYGGGGGSSSNWSAKVGSKTKNLVARVRREARELSVFRGKNSILAAPTHTLKRQALSSSMVDKIRTTLVTENAGGSEKLGEKRKLAQIIDDDDGEEIAAENGNKEVVGANGKKVQLPTLRKTAEGWASKPPAPLYARRAPPADPFLRRKR